MGADLLVLGTHGRTGFERLMLGSVTDKVIVKAEAPVLTVPRGVNAGPDRPVFRRVLCGVDFSQASLRAVEYALSVAGEANGRLSLVHVVEWCPEPSLPISPDFDVQLFRESLVSKAQTRLVALAPEGVKDWLDLDTKIRTGKPYQELLAAAREESADLVVAGVQGYGPADRMLFGSTTQHIVRKAGCPVLTIRP